MTSREEAFEKNADKDWILKEDLELLRRVYLRKHDPRDPLVSPTYGDLQDFPPLFIQVGTHETLFDDVSAFVGKAKEAGVDVTLRCMGRDVPLLADFLINVAGGTAGHRQHRSLYQKSYFKPDNPTYFFVHVFIENLCFSYI